jgi:hypothetical protein
MLLAWLMLGLAPAASSAQVCPSAPLCRETAPNGKLLHERNSKGNRVWTTECNQPNSSPARDDPLCQDIARCAGAGAFGKFLRAVTFDCRAKHFDGYFGLDGMTYGILDWTAENLPRTLAAYQARNPGRFEEVFGKLALPISNGCLDPKWVCENNKQAKLTCDPAFHEAFDKGLLDADFQKAQLDMVLQTYEVRLKRFAGLGLKTEYGNTAMAVVANNLLNNEACRPATWKKECADRAADERELVDCMLDRYVANACRGSANGSIERRDAIKKIFQGAATSPLIHPTADALHACSTRWGTMTRR